MFARCGGVFRVLRLLGGAAAAVILAAAAGCGGKDQSAGEPSGIYKVDFVQHSFPSKQALAQRTEMTIAVRNAGDQAMPNVAVTVDGFDRRIDQAGVGDPSRPSFSIQKGPFDADTAYVNTWATDRQLGPGATAVFRWQVTALHAGTYTLKYKVAAGLTGKAQARLANGSAPEGTFTVRVSGKPAQARVGKDGQVVREPQ
jgi:hypothetical protein